MKTTIAIIRLVLRTNKVLSTGDHPIMLRCSYSGMKEVSTGYSCSIKYWEIWIWWNKKPGDIAIIGQNNFFKI